MNFGQQHDEGRREELIRQIEHSVAHLSLPELEAPGPARGVFRPDKSLSNYLFVFGLSACDICNGQLLGRK